MRKVFINKNNVKQVGAAILSGLKKEVNQLNSEDYNYGEIMKNITYFEQYARLLGTYLGIEVNVRFNVEHSSRLRVNMINSTSPRMNLSDLNAAFRSNYNVFTTLISQIEAIYKKNFDNYNGIMSIYKTSYNEYTDYVSESDSEISDLMEALNNTEIITPEEINEAISEARAETEAQVEEVQQQVDELANDVWDSNKGYETASQIQEDGIKAAEEYAENSAHAHEAEQMAEAAAQAQAQADALNEASQQAQNELADALTALAEANSAAEAADAHANETQQNLDAIDTMMHGTDKGYDPGTQSMVPGTYMSDDGLTVYTITDNGDGTMTVATTGNHSGDVSYSEFTVENSSQGVTNAFSENQQANNDAKAEQAQAREDADEARNNANEAQAKADEAQQAAQQAQQEADKAQQEADDASIPYATDDELENGWDGSNNTEDDYGDDNWGDWSDIVGEGIDDGDDGDDDDDDDDGDDDE